MDDKGPDFLSTNGEKEKPTRKTSFGATVRFVKEKKSKENQEAAGTSDDELSRVEVEGKTRHSARKKSSAWIFPAMFSKSQHNSKSDKAPSKQSVFPTNGNILKKKARTTILSVLNKRQTQEKFFLGEKNDGREQQNSTVSSSEPSVQQPKWYSEGMIVDLSSTKSESQRPSSVEVKSQSYHLETPNQNCPSSNPSDKGSEVKSNEQDKLSPHYVEDRQVLGKVDIEQAGIDIVKQDTKESKSSSKLPSQPLYRGRTEQSTQSLSKRRDFAPRHLPCPEQTAKISDGSHAMVVSMSPSYTCMKDITPSSPLSPKLVSDSVKVSIPFQVQGQQQSSRPEQQSHAWSSSVSVCVPFQVNENGAGVSVLPSFDNQPLPTSLLDKETTEVLVHAGSVPFLQQAPKSPSSNSVRSVSESPTKERKTEKTFSSAMNKITSSEPSFPVESSSFVCPDGDKDVSHDMTDGRAATKPRVHPSPTPDKRKLLKENHTRDNQASEVSKEQPSKTMGKEASKHKPTDKPVNSTALKGPTAGKARARSFTAGDKTKLTPGPSNTLSSPAGTPKSRSPASSPKLMRRNATPKDVSKGRNGTRKTAEPKKQESHNRPHSDPIIAEKIHGKKKLSEVAANDTKGKAKPDLESVKNKVKELEAEKLELMEKIQGMEHRLGVVPLLEKEKLHLQKQFNEVVQENAKKSSELQSLNLNLEKQREEKIELQMKHDKLVIALENSQQELEELKDQNHSLEESKSTLVRENEEKMQSITKCHEDIENLTISNAALVLKESRSRSKISTLLQGLRSLKDSVLQLKDENKCLQMQIIESGSELVGRMRNCVGGLEKVIDGLEIHKTDKIEKETQVSSNVETRDKDTQCDELLSVHLILNEVEESKLTVKPSIDEKEKPNERSELPATPNTANEQNKPAICLGCISLEEQLLCLKSNLDALKASLQKTEGDRDDAVEERNELRREAKYLKYVLSYREDVQTLQMSKQQNKELEKMESNLVEAEKKVIDLEDEVGRLQEEKQTLLLSILNLHSGHEVDVVKEEDEEEEENMSSEESERNRDDENQDKGNMSEDSRTPDSISRREQLKFRFQLSLSESDYSYSSERTEGEESESEQEDMEMEISAQSGLHIKKIKTEYKQLKTLLSEANEEKEELLSSLDKLCEEFDSLKTNFDKLEEDHAVLSKRSKQDKETLQARLQEVEIDRENMRESLRQVQDEKLALLQCLEMRNPEPMPPVSPLTQLDLDKIIARAQSFTRAENKSNEPTSNEEDSDTSLSSDGEDENRSKLQLNDKAVIHSTPDNRFRQKGQPEVTQSPAEDRDLQLASLVASIENDLGKLKERLNNRGSDTSGDVQNENIGNGVELRLRKPPPGERILKRQASTVKSNLDRVCREKQHLQDEVESLRRYLLKRRDSAMEIRKKPSHGSLKRAAAEVENHLEGIKTLQALLGKSDEQLRQSNEIISRLEAVNDETEEKLRDSELLQDDMRCAVQIANTFAMEEQERADKLMLQNQELLKTIEKLKSARPSADGEHEDENSKEKPTAKGKSKFQLKGAKGFNRSVSEDDGLYADDESNFTTEGESDFFSSRHSSIASESDLVTSPTSHEDNLDNLNSNVPAECSTKNADADTEGTSQYSSTADTSDLTDDEAE